MSIILSGNTSTGNTSSGLTYTWVTIDGNISGSTTGETITVTTAGTYTLTVTDSYNGLSNSESFTVVNNVNPPSVNITYATLILSTPNQVITLTGVASGVGTLLYNWTTSNGTFTGSTTGVTATVISAGTYTLTCTDTSNNCFNSANVTVTVKVPVVPVAIISPNSGVLTCATPNITLSGVFSYGEGPLTYLWTGGSTASTLNVSSVGTYNLTVTNTTNGLTGFTGVTITNNITTPTASITPSNTEISQAVPTITLTATVVSGHTYAWTTGDGNIVSGANTSVATINAGGTYTLTVTKTSNGCTNTANQLITESVVLPIAKITGQGILTCTIPSRTLNASTSTGATALTYLWTTSATTPTISVSTAGTYGVTVTDTGSQTGYTQVVISQNKVVPTTSITKVPNVTDINSTNPAIMLTVFSGAGYTYSWNTGATIRSISVSDAGTYTVTVTDTNNGCIGTSSVILTKTVIPPPTAIITAIGTADIVSCLDGLTIETIYLNATTDVPLLPVGYTPPCAIGDHQCDRAFTEIYGNGVYIGDSLMNNTNGNTGNTTISGKKTCTDYLNTPTVLVGGAWSGDVRSRYSINTITSQQAIDIASAGVNGTVIDFSLIATDITYGALCGIHNSVTWTRITDSGGTVLYNGCPIGNFLQLNVCSSTTTSVPIIGAVNLSCSATTITLNGNTSTGSQGTTGLSYQWYNGTTTLGTTATLLVTTPSTYTLKVKDDLTGLWSTLASQVVGSNITTVGLTIGAVNGLQLNTTYSELPLTSTVTGSVNKIYQWSTADGTFKGSSVLTASNVIVISAGTYTLKVTDTATGCNVTKSVTVTKLNTNCALTVTIGGQQQLTCARQSVLLTANTAGVAPYSYVWNTGAVTQSINVTAPGVYSVAITDSKTPVGCTGTTTATITQNTVNPIAVITANPSLDIISPATSTNLSGVNSSSTGGITYSWYFNGGTNTVFISTQVSITASNAGIYYLFVGDTNNGCSGFTQVNVTKTVPATPITVNISGNQMIGCSGVIGYITLTANATGTGTLNYAWSASNGGTFYNNVLNTNIGKATSAGTYQVTVTDNYGSTPVTASFIISNPIDSPIVSINYATLQLASGGSILLQGSVTINSTYQWYKDSIAIGGATNQNLTVTTVGNYRLDASPLQDCVIYNGIYNGASVGDAYIHYNDCDDNSLQELILDSNNSSINFCAKEGTAYASGTASVFGPNGNCGGSGTVCVGSNNVTVTALATGPTAIISSGPWVLNCANNDHVTLYGNQSFGTGTLTYQWTTGNGGTILGSTTGSSVVATTTGYYYLQVTDSATNLNSTSYVQVTSNHTVPNIVIQSPDTVISASGEEITLNAVVISGVGPYTYLWSTSNGTFKVGDSLTSSTVRAISGGTYTLKVTDGSNGCFTTTSIGVTVNISTLSVGVVMGTAGYVLNCGNKTKEIRPFQLTGAVGVITYRWYKNGLLTQTTVGGNGYLSNIVTAGAYYLTVTDGTNGNVATSITVNITGTPTDSPPVASIGGPSQVLCVGNITLSSTSTNPLGGTMTHEWKNLTTNVIVGTASAISVPPTGAGTYQLTISNGCVSTATKVVGAASGAPTVTIIPPASSTLPATISSTVTGGGGGNVYLWYTFDGNIISGTNGTTVTISTNGTYYLKVTDTNGCFNTKSITFTASLPASDTQAPTIPGNVLTTWDGLEISVSWNNSTDNIGVLGYEVWESSSSSGLYYQMDTTSVNGWVRPSITQNTNYCYKIKAYDAANNKSAFSNYSCAVAVVNCLVQGTIITDIDGILVPIEDLAVGDYLLSAKFDNLEDSNSLNYLSEWNSDELFERRTSSSIKEIYPFKTNNTIIINKGLLESTPSHTQLVRRDGIWIFVKMGEVMVGDELEDINYQIIKVNTVDINTEERIAYKMELNAPTHMYYANGVLTHNAKAPIQQ